MTTMAELPIIAITIGDPAGVGPEVVAGALANGDLRDVCRPLVIGDRRVMERAVGSMGVELPLHSVASPAEARFTPDAVDLIDLDNVPAGLAVGRVDGAAGRAAFGYIERSTQLALAGEVDA